MVIKVLVENSSIDKRMQGEHGLSLYVETKAHKLLFDVGPDDLFIKNARTINAPVEDVDTLVVSHGHRDHGGGLEAFFAANHKAMVYIQEAAFDHHLVKSQNGNVDVGIKLQEAWLPRLVFVKEYLKIDAELELFSAVTGRELFSPANDSLLLEKNGVIEPDDFAHEQNLIITLPSGRHVLIAGCAHRGIVNIMKRFMEIKGVAPELVIGGFHLMRIGMASQVPDELIDDIGKWLAQYPSRYLTGHCTGQPAFDRLQSILGEQIEAMPTGSIFELN